MSEDLLAQIELDKRRNDPSFISVDDFADMVQKTRQTISHHLNKGRLKRYLDKGELIFQVDRQYYIHRDLAKLFPDRKFATTSATIDDDEYIESAHIVDEFAQNKSQNISPQPQPDLIRFMETTMDRIATLSEDRGKYLLLEDQRKSAETAIENQRKLIFELEAKVRQLEAQLSEKDAELTDLKARAPGWMFWKK